jgi:hypothetical protein
VVLYWGIHNPQAWISVEVFDCMGTSVIEFYIYCIAFNQDMFTSCFGSIMVYMRVSLVEPSFKTVMGQVPVLE